MNEKKRLDAELVDRGILGSRELAKAAIMAGEVYVNGQRADKAGDPVTTEDAIEFRGDTLRYVSRGGLKLEKALAVFPGISPAGRVCMDVGASTGGFTDCMLQNGAEKVYAVDVGYGQLAWSLRTDPRVVNLERTNARYLTKEQVPEPVGLVSIDVSFISLNLVLPVLLPFLAEDAAVVCLVKPQFEAGREKVGKHGVVREPETHLEVIKKVLSFARGTGYGALGLDFSPVKGPQGNIEYLLALSKDPSLDRTDLSPEAVVAASHDTLN